METFLIILNYVGAPLLGALIGCFTNWLAVKMLFRPYYPKKIGKWRLPFTPGIIPKRKSALAAAVGKAVGEQLFTKDDLAAAVVSENATQKVAERAKELWRAAGDKTANEIISLAVPAEKAEAFDKSAQEAITDRVFRAVKDFGLGGVVASEGVKVIKQKKSALGMLAMFLSDDLISSLADKLADGVDGYVDNYGRQAIRKAVSVETEKLLNQPLSPLVERVDDEIIAGFARSLYSRAVKEMFAGLADELDVCAIVEQKINAMSVKELEKLVLSVMKKELNAIVNLGALIGFILGVLMIFV